MRDLTAVKDALKNHQIELPSWAFGNSGTRFKVFGQPGVPRDPLREGRRRRAGARSTPASRPVMAVHIPWDKVDDYAALAAHAKSNGIRIGTVNSNVFQDDDYKLGSPSATPTRGCARRPSPTCSSASTSWTPPARGTSSSGSPTAPTTPARTTSPPARTGSPRRWPPSTAARATVSGCCWSTSCSSRPSTPPTCPTGAPACCTARRSAPGRRSSSTPATTRPGVNIEFIVALLLKAGKLGGFDFNSRFYADDDLMVGAADPFQLFRIMHEVVKAGALAPAAGVASCSTSATTSSRRSPRRSARS